MNDIEMLQTIQFCLASTMGCSHDCPLINTPRCRDGLVDWLMEYVERLKRQEDDLK